MKVALITNWKEHCGVSEYAVNLVSYLTRDVEYTIVSKPLTYEHIKAASNRADILHFNYCSYTFRDIALEEWGWFRDNGKKVMMTFHDSSQPMIHKVAASGVFDKVIVHEKADADWEYLDNVTVIPQGVNLLKHTGVKVRRRTIGTVGCPFPWKGFEAIARAASRLEMWMLALISDSDSDAERLNSQEIGKHLQDLCPESTITTGWQPYSLMTRDLSECTLLAFPYDEKKELFGISSAVRCGLATRRPVIVSRSSQFRDLFEYEDEIYFMDNGLDNAIEQVLEDIHIGRPRIPNRVLLDMRWEQCARLYLNVYKELYDSKPDDARE